MNIVTLGEHDVPLAIETESLRKEYGDTVAVTGLSLRVESGSVYGFLGPNGAGKTTTMRMLTTLTAPTSGRARVAGASIEDRASVTSRIGFLPDVPPLYDELTAREQLRYAGGIRDLPAETIRERVSALLDRFDLSDDADRRLGEYSRGMRKRVGLIQILLHDPDVVFLDEPTSGLDPRSARTMRRVIEDLADDETTVFLSSHLLTVVEALADRVGVIQDGRLVTEGPLDAVKREAQRDGESEGLEAAFLEMTEGRSE
ncbi:daunorubicin ABC transporter ATPase [Haloferax gibbonsii]|uniref:Daunorubicin ABC transporter ATPase n=1 Tax=Haloferax gibbonsii TaxID=35746 RepID=A0A0K1IVB9_HALGI|nr:daunorubicin ABC transporter ATPase [Haloferax gibbonsii]